MELEKVFETIKEQCDKIEHQRKLDFIKCLENTKGTGNIITKVREKGVPTHLMLSNELEKLIPKENRIRTFLTVVPCSYFEPNQMFFYWHKEMDFIQQHLKPKN